MREVFGGIQAAARTTLPRAWMFEIEALVSQMARESDHDLIDAGERGAELEENDFGVG